jgi:hypothetical protein
VFIAEDAPRAVLLEPAELFADPTSAGEILARWPAGTVLEYAGEITDEFGRTWHTVRDPNRLQRRHDVYLTPFSRRQFRDYGYRGALLADRQPVVAVAVVAASAPPPPPWWQPVGVLELGHNATFDGVVGISATAADPGELRQAIELLGGMAALGDFPAQPVPGELFVSMLLPALFQFDGEDWDLARPVRLMDDAVNLLGNGSFMVDRASPPLAGGPALHCWDLIDSLDPRGDPAGSVQVALPPVVALPPGVPLRSQPLPSDMGPFDMTAAPLEILRVLPPAPDTTRVPARVDPRAQPSGVLLADNASRQAVYLQQRLGGDLARRLRGMPVTVDVVARDAPVVGSATFGINVEAALAGNRTENFAISFTTKPSAARYELAFEVPADAEDLTVRLLPLDRSLAREQRGSVVFERAGLRLSGWDPDPPPGAVVLNRISANSFEGAELHTRARVAVTDRSVEEIQRAWLDLAAADWSAEDQAIVLAGELRHGMSPDQVAAAWGRPDADTSQASDAGVERRWEYADGRSVVFFDDDVITFRDRSTAARTATARRCTLDTSLPGTGMWP